MAEGDFPKADGEALYASEVNQFIRDLARGLTPTTTTWGTGTAPTTLTNITDGDLSTAAGEAIGTGTTRDEYVTIDLGAEYLAHKVFYKFFAHEEVDGATDSTVDIEVADAGLSYTSLYSTGALPTSTTEFIGSVDVPTANVLVRYIRFHIVTVSLSNDTHFTAYHLGVL